MRGLPCAACLVEGFSVNAHVAPASEKGTGYKADAKWIVPLCDTHEEYEEFFGEMRTRMGCHKLYDEYPITFRARFPEFNREDAARTTNEAWLSFSGVSPKTG